MIWAYDCFGNGILIQPTFSFSLLFSLLVLQWNWNKTSVINSFILFVNFRNFQASDQLKRYDNLTNQCRTISSQQDLNSFVKILQPESPPKVPKKSYAAPTNDIDEVCPFSSWLVLLNMWRGCTVLSFSIIFFAYVPTLTVRWIERRRKKIHIQRKWQNMRTNNKSQQNNFHLA